MLIELLSQTGIGFPETLSAITRFTQFGTTFRYDNFEPTPSGERVKWLELIQGLRACFEPLIR